LRSTKMESRRCVLRSRDAHEAERQPPESDGYPRPLLTVSPCIYREVTMATKDKNTKKSVEKKPAQTTLKEKRQAKKAKK
jgi:hypothetical protein